MKFENLEGRALLAGNVLASFAEGNLALFGDSADNEIRVGMSGADLVVEGRNGTTINGSADDFVVVSGGDTIPGSFFAHLRPGDDNLLLQSIKIRGATTIKGGQGIDTIEIRDDSELDGEILIRAGRQNDVVFLHDNTTGVNGNLAVRGRRGEDTIGLSGNVIVGNVDIRGNADNDDVAAFDNTFNGAYRADGGQAPDSYGEDAGSNVFNGSRVVTRFSNMDTEVTTNIRQFLPALPAEPAPTPTITAGQLSPTNADTINVTVDFGEQVNGFVVGDLNIGNGTASNFNTADNQTFTFDVAPAADGPVTVDVPSGVAQDATGNDNTAARQFSITSDRTPPTPIISAGQTSPTNANPINFTVDFGEAVDGFIVGDLAIGNGTASNFATADNQTFTFDVTPTTDGVVSVDIAGGVAQDAAGNNNAAATQVSVTSDRTAPTVVVSGPSAADSNNGPIDFSVTYNGATAINLRSSDVILNKTGTADGSVTVINRMTATPTVRISGISGDGTLGISIDGGRASDAAGNTDSGTGPSVTFNVDNTRPMPTISSSQFGPIGADPISVSVDFGEPVDGFAAGDLTIGNGTASNLVSPDNQTFTFDVSPTANGPVTVDIASGVAQDAAGNDNVAATQFAILADLSLVFVEVGDPNNGADTQVMRDDTSGYGSVAAAYRISAFEITNDQYAEFLNAVAATDSNNLYNTNMSSSGGIDRNGAPGSYTYQVQPGEGNLPVNFVSFYDALRYANWLHNGKPNGLQGSTTTEDGAYTFTAEKTLQAGSDPTHGANGRNAGARFWLPSENQWYKAAYFDPATNTYFNYATGSDTDPTAEFPPGGSNSANYDNAVGNLTDVGAYVNSPSPYGTLDQSGNVFEWNEQMVSATTRGLRGGSFDLIQVDQQSSFRFAFDPSFEDFGFGFRVASRAETTP